MQISYIHMDACSVSASSRFKARYELSDIDIDMSLDTAPCLIVLSQEVKGKVEKVANVNIDLAEFAGSTRRERNYLLMPETEEQRLANALLCVCYLID